MPRIRAGTRRLRWVAVACAALLTLVALPSSAQDVCALEGAALNTTLETAADEIAAFARTSRPLLLNEGGAFVQRACNWECGTADVITSMVNAFGFLKYNCKRTAAPESTRRPTGPGTASQMGLSVTDADYRAATDEIFRADDASVGDLMRVPSAIEEASKSGRVQAVVDAVDAMPGASWLKFSSTSVDNDRDGAARILVRVIDGEDPPRFEQWIQIAISASTGRLGRNVDFLARQLVADSASPLDDGPIMAFRGYSRTANGFVPEGTSGQPELSRCYSCHPSGLRAVVPATVGTVAAGGGRAIAPEGTLGSDPDLATQLDNVKTLTSELARFGPVGYDASENGPPFGPSIRIGRADAVAAGCAANLAEDRREAIVAQMDCEMCHDGSTRGYLRAGTSRLTIYHKVVKNMEAPMPPGVTDSLDAAEREILYRCLKAEYADSLREWLTQDLLEIPTE